MHNPCDSRGQWQEHVFDAGREHRSEILGDVALVWRVTGFAKSTCHNGNS